MTLPHFIHIHLKHFALLLCVFVIHLPSIIAQEACFEVVPNVACNQAEVQVVDCTVGAVNISYKYTETEGFVNRTTNTYNAPGTYTITQLAQFNVGGSTQAKLTTREVTILPTPLPEFGVRLCSNRAVAVNITDTSYPQYFINWGDGSPLQSVSANSSLTIHTYLLGGTYSVSVTGNYIPGNCGGTNAVVISPINTLSLPQISQIITQVSNATNGEVEIRFEADSNFRYEFYLENSTSPLATVENTQGLASKTITGLNTNGQSPCFNISTFDVCGNSLRSEAIYCALSLNASAEDSQNRVQWTSYPSLSNLPSETFLRYILYRNDQPVQVFTNQNANSFIDTEINCNIEYCYRIEASFSAATLQFTSNSDLDCVNAFSSQPPQPISRLNATVEGNRSIRLFWDIPQDERIREYRISRSGAEFISLTSESEAIDTDLVLNKRYCYEIFYINDCGISSPISGFACPVFLQAISPEAGVVRLNWSTYQNSNNSFEYYAVEKLDENNEVYDEIILNNVITNQYQDPDAKTDRQVLRYRIRTVIEEAGGLVSYSNIVEVAQNFRIFFPNAFTPNEDGKNDSFIPKGLFINQFKMQIYGQNGELLFKGESLEESWDGTYKGQLMPSGVYVYLVELEDFTGQKFTKRGTFNLIR